MRLPRSFVLNTPRDCATRSTSSGASFVKSQRLGDIATFVGALRRGATKLSQTRFNQRTQMSLQQPPNATAPRARLIARYAVLALFVGVIAGLATALVELDPLDADVKYDWLSAKAAISSNAYTDILTLGENEGVDLIVRYPQGAERPFPHPRTPGAILLALSILLIDFHNLFAVSVGVTVGLGVFIIGLLTSSLGARKQFGVLALLAASAPFVTTLRFAGQSMIVAAAVITAWMLYERGRDMPAGALIAIAGVLKLFRLILIIPMLLQRRFKAAAITAGGLVGLTLIGLLLPGVAFGEAVAALTHGSEVWFSLLSNGSMAAFLARWGVNRWVGTTIALVLSVTFIAWANRKQRNRLLRDPVIWLALSLLLLPVSWVSYDIVLVSGLVMGLWSQLREHRTVNVGIWGLWIGMSLAYLFLDLEPDQALDMGVPTFMVRVLVILAWATGAIGWSGSPWLSDDHDRLDGSRLNRHGFSQSTAMS